MKCKEIMTLLELLSPKKYACSWDNVGLMTGNADSEITKVLVALEADDTVIQKAIDIEADMIVTHHPLIFGGVKTVTTDTLTGRRIVKLIQNNICCYSMHTNFDVKGGMAELAANLLQMKNPEVLEPVIEDEGLGRVADFVENLTIAQWVDRVKQAFGVDSVTVYGNLDTIVNRIAVAPGSGGDSISFALEKQAEVLITGDIKHHTGTDALAMGLNIIDAGHYGTEHIFIDFIAAYLENELRNVEVIRMEKKIPYQVL